MLNVGGINVYYGDLQALRDISFSVSEGEIVAIIGSNGAGKTTLLKTISGLLTPRSGTIEFLGKRVDKLRPHQIVDLGIAHVPEGRHLFPKMTVLENLEMGASSHRARKRKDDNLERVYQLFPILKERKNQLAGSLSGGEQQMLAIARGLMSEPKLLMLDEPSLGLSPKMVICIFDMIKTINEDGTTILLVEQNVRHALALAERAYILEVGRVVRSGKGKELLEDDYVKKAYLGI
jgi:branched-chain amino acid transport system ATP-binding protein